MKYNQAQVKHLKALVEARYGEKCRTLPSPYSVRSLSIEEKKKAFESGDYEIDWSCNLIKYNWDEKERKIRQESHEKLKKERDLLITEILFGEDAVGLVKKIQEW